MRISKGVVSLDLGDYLQDVFHDFIFHEALVYEGNKNHLYYGNWWHHNCYWMVLE